MAYKKGQSGNLKGRPKKGETITDALTDLMLKNGNKEKLARKLYDMAIKGNIKAIELIYNRVDGKPKENFTGSVDIETGENTFNILEKIYKAKYGR